MSVVTVTILHYRPEARFRAFANMGRSLMTPFVAAGLTFQKLLGSGHNFGLLPNFSTYVFLGVWDTEIQANQFLTSSDFGTITEGTDTIRTLYLEPYQSHGHWDGINPFVPTDVSSKNENAKAVKPIAVLTRATIRPGALLDFWRHVPAARQKLAEHKDNLLFAIGVGEKPIVQQCTISVWRSQEAVEQFAYRQSGHKEVVRQSRNRHWFSEELFARFAVIKAEGFGFLL